MTPEIRFSDEDRGARHFLSNRYPSPVYHLNREFRNVDRAFLASRSMHPADHRAICDVASRRRALELHAAISMVRPFWPRCRIGIMMGLLEQKFTDKTLARKLVATYPKRLIFEDADPFWGCSIATLPYTGLNRLGEMLEIVRDNVRLGRGTPYLKHQTSSRERVRNWRMANSTKRLAGEPYVPGTPRRQAVNRSTQKAESEYRKWLVQYVKFKAAERRKRLEEEEE